ncbi:MAG: Coproporphyrinogen oxidase family protein [Armatimonadetes bacterium]|jgi:oxygen-independent coproporphyrinogen-3 oxidase|nr:Coproporphyrinogen oxidase family protein [Armatimonadota bacterium]
MSRLAELLRGAPFAGYAYSYPHKTAYRPLDPPVPLEEAWAGEDRSAAFLYLHVPFCEMRCGFCNLFTTANPAADVEQRYLAALRRQALRVREAIGPLRVGRMAIGGGTPTYLAPDDLAALLALARELFGADAQQVSASVETSPLTATPERLQVLHDHGVERISIGVQSFRDEEAAAAGRPQKRAAVEAALGRIRAVGFPRLNLDLMYGLPGQTVETWRESLHAALEYQPEELYLYPLYVRPLTGLDRRGAQSWDELRLACYRVGRDLLREHGYTQLSMRHFGRRFARAAAMPEYRCQEDAMLGLGCGARSYTRTLHYSSEYAVGRAGVREILAEYLEQPEEAFGLAGYGFALDTEEQRRRFAIKSLLHAEGLSLADYRERFGTDALADLPELSELLPHRLAEGKDDRLVLTTSGMEYSDVIGPWLYSPLVRERSEQFDLR